MHGTIRTSGLAPGVLLRYGGARMSTQETLDRIDTSWRALLDLLATVPADAWNEPVVGEWTLTHLLGHIGLWDTQALQAARHYARGGAKRNIDPDAVNAMDHLRHRGSTFAEQEARLLRDHELLVTGLAEIPDVQPEWVAVDTFDHYDEHRAQVEAWLAQRGA